MAQTRAALRRLALTATHGRTRERFLALDDMALHDMARASFPGEPPGSTYGLCLFNEGQVRVWPCPRANGEHTTNLLQRLRAAIPDDLLTLVWNGASPTGPEPCGPEPCGPKPPALASRRRRCRAAVPPRCRWRRSGAGCGRT